MAAGKRSVDALVQRGVPLRLAQSLVAGGRTLAALQQLPPDKLKALGLPSDAVENLGNSVRPSIPFATLDQLLRESNYRCSVCKGGAADVIIHHIVEWCEGGTHDEANLIVLCLQHHSDAHSKKSLALNLSPELLRAAKADWVQTVRKENAAAALANPWAGFQDAMWDYFNHSRLLDRLHSANIRIESASQFKTLLSAGQINEDGAPKRASALGDGRRFMYEGGLFGSPRFLYGFYAELLERLLQIAPWIHLEDCWNKRAMLALNPGQLVVLRGLHHFRKNRNSVTVGPGQTVRGSRKRRGIEVTFLLDAWEATSSSAYGGHLAGGQIVTSIGVVRSVAPKPAALEVATTCLAVGTGFGNERPRRTLSFEYEEIIEPEEPNYEPDADDYDEPA